MLCIYHQWIYSNNIKDNCQLPRYRENNLLALYIITQMFFSQLKVKHIDNSMDNYTFDVGIGYLCITTDCYSDISSLFKCIFLGQGDIRISYDPLCAQTGQTRSGMMFGLLLVKI